MIFVTIIFILSIIAGMICTIVGGVTAGNSQIYVFPPFIGVGMGLSIFGTIVFIFGVIIIRFRRITRMREAIAEESIKYS